MLTEQQRSLVRETWAMVVPDCDTVATLFYDRLFLLDPSLHKLFLHSDMQSQGRKLVQMLDVAVAQLARLDTLSPAVAALGTRHVSYGVRDEHYDTVGAALLWTLQQGLGALFTDDVREAWTETYGLLASVMRGGAATTVAAAG